VEVPQIPAYHEYPSSGEIEPNPCPMSFTESTTVICAQVLETLEPS